MLRYPWIFGTLVLLYPLILRTIGFSNPGTVSLDLRTLQILLAPSDSSDSIDTLGSSENPPPPSSSSSKCVRSSGTGSEERFNTLNQLLKEITHTHTKYCLIFDTKCCSAAALPLPACWSCLLVARAPRFLAYYSCLVAVVAGNVSPRTLQAAGMTCSCFHGNVGGGGGGRQLEEEGREGVFGCLLRVVWFFGPGYFLSRMARW